MKRTPLLPRRATSQARRLDVVLPCPLCGRAAGDEVYRREVETHSALGRVEMRLELCPDCGLLFTNPRPRRAELRAHYESKAASGNTFHATGAGSRAERFLAYRRGLLERAAATFERPGALLDVGCSTGDLLAACDLPGWRLAGLEVSTVAAQTARARGLEVTCAALEASPLPIQAFEVVACISCLEHAFDVREFFAALDRHVKPGGVLVLSVPDSSAPVAQVTEFFGFEHLTHWTRTTVLRFLRQFGYSPLLVEQTEGPALNVAARRVGARAAAEAAEPYEASDLATTLAAYVRARSALEHTVRAALEARVASWLRRGRRVAIYGAGVHTRFLLDLVGLAPCVAALIDSDPSKRGEDYLGWTIHAPEDLPALGVDAVIVSSKPFQQEMVLRIAPLAEAAGIEVVTIYPETQAVGP